MATNLHLSQEGVSEYFAEVLDEGQELIKVAGYSFTPSQVLMNCDPTAYRCEMANFIDTLIKCGYEIEE
jgi:hypothetical protein